MSDNEQQAEPEVKPDNTHVSVKIQGASFPPLVIKLKRTTKLLKMMTAYCERAGKTPGEVRFMFDGRKLNPTDTIADLDVDEDDEEVIVDVASEAVGGQ